MAYEKLTGTFESSNGTDNCAYYIYVPVLPMNVGYKGIIQISHGMCEYIERYCFLRTKWEKLCPRIFY